LRLNLLLGLKSNRVAKMWEYEIFIEFLEEKLGKDELYFFLHS